jgi:hypothetical protein
MSSNKLKSPLLQQILKPQDPDGIRATHDETCEYNFVGPYCHGWGDLYPASNAAERKVKAKAEVAEEVTEEVTEQDVMEQNAEESDTEEWKGV